MFIKLNNPSTYIIIVKHDLKSRIYSIYLCHLLVIIHVITHPSFTILSFFISQQEPTEQECGNVVENMAVSNKRPIAVITGASSGIGKALAIDLISSGWNVCILARSENKLKEIANKYNSNDIDIKVIKCDVQESAQIVSACKQIKEWSGDTLNLLVNNVGGGSGMGNSLENISIKDWDFDINLNLDQHLFLLNNYYLH